MVAALEFAGLCVAPCSSTGATNVTPHRNGGLLRSAGQLPQSCQGVCPVDRLMVPNPALAGREDTAGPWQPSVPSLEGLHPDHH